VEESEGSDLSRWVVILGDPFVNPSMTLAFIPVSLALEMEAIGTLRRVF